MTDHATACTIRDYQPSDAPRLWEIFFNTVRTACSRDYSPAQLIAWAPDKCPVTRWTDKMSTISPYIAQIDDAIAGYADLQHDGYIDHFFCNHAFIGQGVGGILMRHIIAQAHARGIQRLYADVSITAKPFFEHFGFTVETTQTVPLRGQYLKNFTMALHFTTSE